MEQRGARHLVLLSRSGPVSDSAKALVEDLQSQGVHIEAPAIDITKLAELKSVLTRLAESMPPIRGCIQATVVLRVRVSQIHMCHASST